MNRRHYIFALALAAADLLTKWWAVETLESRGPVEVIPGLFDLALVRNSGVAFGLFQGVDSPIKPVVLSAIAVGALAAVVFYSRQVEKHQTWTKLVLSMVMGGILGNFFDRIHDGSVVDFIEIYWRSFHWPTFNLADSAISVGIVLLLVDSLRPR